MALLERIDPAKDADGLHPGQPRAARAHGRRPAALHPRTASVLRCRSTASRSSGAEVAVVGRGITVGRSLGLLLTRRSENAP
ncbi:hypothetical protein [Nonomuraea rubra]|uniref:hypothetical protein n=1 Tax=Nonomuraea rubra TaxID=46180 RepID=UPI003CD083FD